MRPRIPQQDLLLLHLMVDHLKSSLGRDRLRRTENLTEGFQEGFQEVPPILKSTDLVRIQYLDNRTHQNLQSGGNREILKLTDLVRIQRLNDQTHQNIRSGRNREELIYPSNDQIFSILQI
jgi:hypothetical protein